MSIMMELRKKLLAEIKVRLAPEGYRKSQQRFTRAFSGGSWIFHVAFVPHATDFAIIADVAVRHESVQQASRLYDHLNDAEKKQTATLGVELGNLQRIGQHRWTVKREDDVVPVADSIIKMFKEVGVPFLQRFSSLEETKRVLLEDEEFSRLIFFGGEYRAELAAFLTKAKAL